jgi:hypothetical protein
MELKKKIQQPIKGPKDAYTQTRYKLDTNQPPSPKITSINSLPEFLSFINYDFESLSNDVWKLKLKDYTKEILTVNIKQVYTDIKSLPGFQSIKDENIKWDLDHQIPESTKTESMKIERGVEDNDIRDDPNFFYKDNELKDTPLDNVNSSQDKKFNFDAIENMSDLMMDDLEGKFRVLISRYRRFWWSSWSTK